MANTGRKKMGSFIKWMPRTFKGKESYGSTVDVSFDEVHFRSSLENIIFEYLL